MTPERNLIEAILEAIDSPHGRAVDTILTTPTVQAALDALWASHDKASRFRAGMEATPKPEPVLRWEGDDLFLGGNKVATAFKSSRRKGYYGWCCRINSAELFYAPTPTEARTAAEQAVRDWLKRAGCV